MSQDWVIRMNMLELRLKELPLEIKFYEEYEKKTGEKTEQLQELLKEREAIIKQLVDDE